MRTTARRAPGFTLVEVMVALVVLALIAAMGWQGVDGIVRTRDASQQRLDATLRLNAVIAQWEIDLAAVQATPDVPALAFDGRTLRLTRRTDSGLQVVAWALNGPAWQRWAGAPVTTRNALQEQWIASQQLVGTEAGQLRAIDGVDGWQLFFWRNNAWSNAQSSGDVEPPQPAPGSGEPVRARESLPTGVRLAMQFADGGGYTGTLTRDVVLGPQQP